MVPKDDEQRHFPSLKLVLIEAQERKLYPDLRILSPIGYVAYPPG